MTFRKRERLAVLALWAISLSGCAKEYSQSFPTDVGFSMLEPCQASLPAATESDPTPETLGTPVMGQSGGHNYAHGRAFVKAPLDAVWQALQDPMVSHIHGANTTVLPGEESFPLSFRIDYTVHEVLMTVEWQIAYRGGATAGTVDAPLGIGMRYQEIIANQYVRLQSGSLEAAPADGVSDVTAVSFVCWLDATSQQPSDAWGTVQDWFNDLVAKVHGQPLP